MEKYREEKRVALCVYRSGEGIRSSSEGRVVVLYEEIRSGKKYVRLALR